MRLHLARAGDLESSREKIEEYVDVLTKRMNHLGALGEMGAIVSRAMFLLGAVLNNNPLMAIGLALGAKQIMGTRVIGGPIRKICESGIPKNQVVKFVRRHAGR